MRYGLTQPRKYQERISVWLRFILPFAAVLLTPGTFTWAAESNLSGAEPTPVDIFALNQGIAQSSKLRAENIDRSTDNEFLDFSRAFVKKDGRWVFTISAEDSPENYRYVGLGPIPVQPMHRYSLLMEFSNLDTDFINLATITFLEGNTKTLYNNIRHQARSDFGTPPNVNRVVVWLGVSSGSNKLVAPGPKVEFRSLKLADLGPMRGTPVSDDAKPGENLLPVSDFENESLGAFINRTYFFPGYGPDTKENHNVFAETVKDDSKRLHIVKKPHDYIYPRFDTRRINLNGCALLFTCRIKGTGKVAPGIWWWLKGVEGTAWSYYSGNEYDLTDTWQTMRLWRACVDDTDYAACAFIVGSPEADFCVDDLSLTIIPTLQTIKRNDPLPHPTHD